MGAGCRCLCGVIFVVLGMDRLIKKKVSFVGTMQDEGCLQPHRLLFSLAGILLSSRNMLLKVL